MTDHRGYFPASHNVTRWSSAGWFKLSRGALSAAMLLVDIAAIITIFCVVGIAYHLIVHDRLISATTFLNIGVLAGCTFSFMSLVRGDYAVSNILFVRSRFLQIVDLWNLTFVSLLILGFITKSVEHYSRGTFLLIYVVTPPILTVLRILIARSAVLATQSGLIHFRRVFLFGTRDAVREFSDRSALGANGVLVVGCHYVDLDQDKKDAGSRARLNADLDTAVEAARGLDPESIILLLPPSTSEVIDSCIDRFMSLPVEIHLDPGRILQRFSDAKLLRLRDFVSLRLTRTPLSQIEIASKRVFDFVGAAFGLILLAPLLIGVAILIKLDSKGPVLFFQRRYGFNQRPFKIVKFRTMHTLEDGAVIRQAMRDDPRVTRVGRWLRRLNIDEIPQLLNVLMGDMSLVGPRPHAVAHDEEYEKKISIYARRQKVKPGITGWAQVNGFRGATDTQEAMEQRVNYDLYYIENWSLFFDVWILIKTVLSAAAYRNAY
ncbi:MAG: undecaprenyl-phosphate glucose phosphotransferase [Methylovirgula sp.]